MRSGHNWSLPAIEGAIGFSPQASWLRLAQVGFYVSEGYDCDKYFGFSGLNECGKTAMLWILVSFNGQEYPNLTHKITTQLSASYLKGTLNV